MSKKSGGAGWCLLLCACALVGTFADTVTSFAQGRIRAVEVVARIKPPTARIRTSPRRKPVKQQPIPTYLSDQPIVKTPPPAMEYAQVGVTIWRLGDGAKELTQEGDERLEQLEAATPLALGSRVRIGIEPLSHDGYLYVIDREQFADGSFGTPSLIFPTLRTRKGNNRVKANQLIYIPAPPSYFRINASRTGKTQVAEVLTILYCPTPLELPAPITDKPLVLSAELVKEWETLWGIRANRLELEGGAGQVTPAKAQTERSRDLEMIGDEAEPLADDDALPQTVYRAAIKVGSPLLLSVPLRFK